MRLNHPHCLHLDDLPKARRHLEVRGSMLLNKNGVKHVECAGRCLLVVRLVVDEDQQRVAQAVYLLPSGLERTGSLRLSDAGDLHINREFWEVDSTR